MGAFITIKNEVFNHSNLWLEEKTPSPSTRLHIRCFYDNLLHLLAPLSTSEMKLILFCFFFSLPSSCVMSVFYFLCTARSTSRNRSIISPPVPVDQTVLGVRGSHLSKSCQLCSPHASSKTLPSNMDKCKRRLLNPIGSTRSSSIPSSSTPPNKWSMPFTDYKPKPKPKLNYLMNLQASQTLLLILSIKTFPCLLCFNLRVLVSVFSHIKPEISLFISLYLHLQHSLSGQLIVESKVCQN